MNLGGPTASFALTSTATPTSTHVTGASTLGTPAASIPFNGLAGALDLAGDGNGVQYAVGLDIAPGAVVELNIATGLAAVTTPGAPNLHVVGPVSYSTGTGTNSALPADLLYAGENGGEHSWSTTGSYVPNPLAVAAPYVQISVDTGVLKLFVKGSGGNSVFACSTMDPLTGSWTAVNSETGTPVVTEIADTGDTIISDGDGKDFEGKTLPEILSLAAVLFRITSGTAYITSSAGSRTFPEGKVLFEINPAGDTEWLETIEIAATTERTALVIDVLGAQ